MGSDICVAVASNNQDILARNIQVSELVQTGKAEFHVERNAVSAAIAYNQMLDQSDAEYMVFAHQDVYFPPGWDRRLLDTISRLDHLDQNWAVIAATGISTKGEHVGPVWSSGQGGVVGAEITSPTPAQSVDELVIVLRRGSGLRFSDDCPGFHLFGTDIVQTAIGQGKGAYICNLPVVHNDVFHHRLGADFGRGYGYIRRKWRSVLPIRTTVLWVTRSGFDWAYYRLRAALSVAARRAMAVDPGVDPRIYSNQCGWEAEPAFNGATGPVNV